MNFSLLCKAIWGKTLDTGTLIAMGRAEAKASRKTWCEGVEHNIKKMAYLIAGEGPVKKQQKATTWYHYPFEEE